MLEGDFTIRLASGIASGYVTGEILAVPTLLPFSI